VSRPPLAWPSSRWVVDGRVAHACACIECEWRPGTWRRTGWRKSSLADATLA
jgi:hypothetical protein